MTDNFNMQYFLSLIFIFIFNSCELERSVQKMNYEKVCTQMGFNDTISLEIDLKSKIDTSDIVILLNNKVLSNKLDPYVYSASVDVDELKLNVSIAAYESDYPNSVHIEVMSRSQDRIIVSDIYSLNWIPQEEPNGEGCGYRYRSEVKESEL